MASLTEVSIYSRRFIRYSIYALILFFILRFSFYTALSLYKRMFPKPPPPPTVSFGKLDKLPFPEKFSSKDIKYTLETPDGKLPKVVEQLPVYFMPESTTNIRALEIAKNKAAALGFISEGKNIVESIPNVYLFRKRNSSALLTMNIVTGIFSISYNFSSDPSIYSYKPNSEEQAIETVRDFINTGNFTFPDMNGTPKTVFLKISNGELVPAISLSETNFVKVSLFRKNITFREAAYLSVSQDYPEGNVWFLTNGQNVFAGEFHYYPMDETKFGTYPIKTADKAWEELNAGKVYIANIKNIDEKNVVIRRVYLSYYDAGQYAKYYQPVFVFEGDNDFFGFVPAVSGEYYPE